MWNKVTFNHEVPVNPGTLFIDIGKKAESSIKAHNNFEHEEFPWEFKGSSRWFIHEINQTLYAQNIIKKAYFHFKMQREE